MSRRDPRGYYGQTTGMDRYEAHNQQSTIHKLKETYWTTKQSVYKKLGKKEDEHVVASDAQLDSKLEVFKAIQKSCMDLLRALEKYQDGLCALSQEENAMGRFLKANSKEDKTRAGKMMAGVGKAQSFSSQQRLALRVPLVRLYQEVETFRYRAISDTLMTINRMETARTEYRGALMWMKDVSEELDPDTYKQLEKFRKVQAQVKKTKAKFDRLKLDTMQKIDLLAASRCNMFSHVLANYQSTLLHFWSKTSRTMTAVAESFKGYQYYEFNMLKELAEPSKKLAEETKGREGDDEEASDKEGQSDGEIDSDIFVPMAPSTVPSKEPNVPTQPTKLYGRKPQQQESPEEQDSLLTNGDMSSATQNNAGNSTQSVPQTSDLLIDTSSVNQEDSSVGHADISSMNNVNEAAPLNEPSSDDKSGSVQEETNEDLLIDLMGEKRSKENSSGSMSNLLEDKDFGSESARPRVPNQDIGTEDFLDFGDLDDEKDLEEIKRKQDAEFDITGKIIREEKKKAAKQKGAKDLLTDDLEPDELDKDDMSLLNEILNAPSTGGDEFSQEWQAVFGAAPTPMPTNQMPAEVDQQGGGGADFMPSNLLDMTAQMSSMRMTPGMQQGPGMGMMGQGMPGAMGMGGMMPPGGQQQNQPKPQQPKGKKAPKTDMSAWFSLFADLDPLANPDAVGRHDKDVMDMM